MLHVHVAQIAYNYSDPVMEDALYGIESLRRFCCIRLKVGPLLMCLAGMGMNAVPDCA